MLDLCSYIKTCKPCECFIWKYYNGCDYYE